MPPVVDETGQDNSTSPLLMKLGSSESHDSSHHQQLPINEDTDLMNEDEGAGGHDDGGVWYYSVVILVLACVGLVVNISAIVLINVRKRTGIFHRLLKVSDEIVQNDVSILNNSMLFYACTYIYICTLACFRYWQHMIWLWWWVVLLFIACPFTGPGMVANCIHAFYLCCSQLCKLP